MEMTEKDAYAQYDDMLDELYPLNGIGCNCFSTLLEAGDPIAYGCGFDDWCDSMGIEIAD